jgi:tyrosyl-tRNA synthetase
MGKSEGNAINLTDKAVDIFGKVMSFPDSLIEPSIELLTDLPLDIAKKKKAMEIKKQLAFEVVRQIKGEREAKTAKIYFETVFQKRKPTYQKEIPFAPTLVEVVANTAKSKSEAKRLIKQGAVDVNGKTILNPTHKISGGEQLKIGKRIFAQIAKQ